MKRASETQPVPVQPSPVTPSDNKDFISHGGGMKTSRPFRDIGYLTRLSRRLKENFVPPRVRQGVGERVAVVYFKILSNGEIVDINLMSSSGHRRVDRAAVRAVEALGRFERLPYGTADLEVSCDFKVE